jgi:membrane-bound lytic murein transglycosylase B
VYKNTLQKYFLVLISLVLAGCATTQYSQQAPVNQFIQKMVVKHHFNQCQLTQLFNQVQPQPHIIQTMTAPHEGLPWYKYRAIFLTPSRAQEGADFWNQHAATLQYAQVHYGVPPQIIVAILGVETRYGRFEGTYRVIDALSTLSFAYPPRATYFQSELEQYLLLTQEMPLDPLAVKGSYAGAIGLPQFMPSSYRHYAVDSTGKGYSNLMSNPDDAILSVANYFKADGWQTGGPVAMPVKQPVITSKRASLLTLKGEQGPEYWLTYHNFHVIMRYNASPQYAMAVYQLSEAILTDYKRFQRAHA